MESTAEKRKREYNRVAQREFRLRRKEHLRKLEQAEKEKNSKQSEEIERLRRQNDELRRENNELQREIEAKTLTGEYTCARCNAYFFRNDLLTRHMARYKEKDYKAGGEGLGILGSRTLARTLDTNGNILNARRPPAIQFSAYQLFSNLENVNIENRAGFMNSTRDSSTAPVMDPMYNTIQTGQINVFGNAEASVLPFHTLDETSWHSHSLAFRCAMNRISEEQRIV